MTVFLPGIIRHVAGAPSSKPAIVPTLSALTLYQVNPAGRLLAVELGLGVGVAVLLGVALADGVELDEADGFPEGEGLADDDGCPGGPGRAGWGLPGLG